MSEGGKKETGDVFDVERIRRLVRLMEEHDLSEIDLRQDEERINLKRGTSAAVPGMIAPMYQPPSYPQGYSPPAYPAPVTQTASTNTAATTPASQSASGSIEGANIVVIKAPMVGTFYNRPNPESEPFVKVGSSVSADTTICIIEAMKVFNEIPAEISGKVVAVLVDNEQSVEYGKPLFKIDTSA